MPRPHVVTHVLVSADGRLDGFPADAGRYYELAGQLEHEAVLSGSGTLATAAAEAGVDLTAPDPVPAARRPDAAPGGPLLVVVDSRGRLTRVDWLLGSGFFGDVVVWGSAATPEHHRDDLSRAGVALDLFGDERVDLAAGLEHLHHERDVTTVRVDAGPGLNGALLTAGLVDEVSLVLAPFLVGHGRGFVEGLVAHAARPLELRSTETTPDGYVWLRYVVR